MKIVVAKMLFAIFGHGQTGENTLRSYLNGEKKDQRTDPYIVKKTNACYSVFIGTSEKMTKIALEAQDACVAYDGHSNFGIGFAFSSGLTNITALMNVGENLMAISWPYMRSTLGHPYFWIEDAEYGDDLTSTNQYDPWVKEWSITGELYTMAAYEFIDNYQAGATNLSLTRGTNKYQDYHFVMNGESGDNALRIIAKCGSSEMPTKNWSKLFLNSCYSGQYYYRIFNHGTLFYTVLECSSSETTKVFIEAIIEGKDNDSILTDINNYENVGDFHSF